MDDPTVDVGQTKIPSLEAIGQPGMINAEEMQNRRVQVVHVDRVLDDSIAQLIGLAD